MSKPILDQKTLRELLDYTPETGEFRWKRRDRKWFASDGSCKSWNTRCAGKVAGHLEANGYRHVRVFDTHWWAHRLAWLWAHGEWPENHIDHIDGNPANNALENLRDVSQSVNMQNQKRARSNNGHTDLLGVYWHQQNKMWCARIVAEGRSLHIGCFDTAEGAHAAYLEAKAKLHQGYVP